MNSSNFARILSIASLLAVSLPNIGRVEERFTPIVDESEYAAGAEDYPSTLFRWNNTNAEPAGGPAGWDDPLNSDRPDFTEASSTVGRGVSQLEMGYTYFLDKDSGSRIVSHSFPEILFRQGFLADWFELRVGWTFNAESQTLSGATHKSRGSDDLYTGFKLGLTPQQGWMPEMALVPQMSVPLGSSFSAERFLPGVNWLYGWDINERFSMAGSSQYNLSVDGSTDRVYGEFAQSWTTGVSITEKLGGYAEWFVLVPAGADEVHTEHYVDGGLTYRWTNNLQFDIRAGRGLSTGATDLFLGAGLVARF